MTAVLVVALLSLATGTDAPRVDAPPADTPPADAPPHDAPPADAPTRSEAAPGGTGGPRAEPDATPEAPPSTEGWHTLLGAGLDAWTLDGDAAEHWRLDGARLRFDGRGSDLWTKEAFGDFDLLVDWRWTAEHQGRMARPLILPDGNEAVDDDGSPRTVEVEERDSGIYLRGSTKAQVNMWMWPVGSGEVYGYRADRSMPAEVRAACTPKLAADRRPGEWNRFDISMRGDRLSVRLNGELVIDGAELPGVPERGPIGLQSHGSPVEFANVRIRPVR